MEFSRQEYWSGLVFPSPRDHPNPGIKLGSPTLQAHSLPTEPLGNAGDPGSIPGLGRSTGEGIDHPLQYSWAFLVAQTVKNLPAMQEIWVPSPGQEDPLEKEMATHSSTLAWRIPRTEKQDRLQFMGLQRVGHDFATNFHFFLYLSMSHLGVERIRICQRHSGRKQELRLPLTGIPQDT